MVPKAENGKAVNQVPSLKALTPAYISSASASHMVTLDSEGGGCAMLPQACPWRTRAFVNSSREQLTGRAEPEKMEQQKCDSSQEN